MDTGGLAQMSHSSFAQPNGLAMPTSGLASRRGGPNVKPLSFESLKSPTESDSTIRTPRTSRSHLLAGLRTAPKSATGATFPTSPSTAAPMPEAYGRNGISSNMYASAHENGYRGPKTSLPRYASQQQGSYNPLGMSHLYTTEQVLAPPEIQIDELGADNMDPTLYGQLVATNMFLAQQQQRLQQQLLSVQAAAQQFQGLTLGAAQSPLHQQQLALQGLYQQQQQQVKGVQPIVTNQPGIYAYVDPVTGQQAYIMDRNAAHVNALYAEQQQLAQMYQVVQQQQLQLQQQQQQQQQQQTPPTPRVQVSPPPIENSTPQAFRNSSPPRKYDSNLEPTPLPPPSANAFRRGHKKASSLAVSVNGSLPTSSMEQPPKSAGPKTACFPLTPLTGGYGPGQARAGEHPIRQPRGPPSLDELASRPTAKHEGSKNFAARTRRSAVHNLVRAGMERRKGTTSSSGSMSPVSESAEEVDNGMTDNDSDSGRSGSGSLAGDVESTLPSSRTSTSGSWGAIGSNRPTSRQKARNSVDSVETSASAGFESENSSSFASVFKNATARSNKAAESQDGHRRAPMLVLTTAEKRKSGSGIMVA